MLQSLAKLSLLEILMEMDYFVEDNWQFIKAGLMEILNKKVPEKRNWVHRVTLHGSQEI